MLHELLPPIVTDPELLSFHSAVQMQDVPLLAALLRVLIYPVTPECRQDAPEESPIRPLTLIELLHWEISMELGVTAHLVPNVLDGVFREPIVNTATSLHFTGNQAFLVVFQDRLQE